MYKEFGISEEIEKLANRAEEEVKEEFKKIEENCIRNSLKVLKAFQEYNVSEIHFNSTTGYGYDDIGRDTIEKIFARVLGSEDSLVRNQFISGTHALTVCLFGLLRPGDTMLSICGKPYDTLDSIIGIEENPSSLKAFGIKYDQVDLVNEDFDIPAIIEKLKNNKIKLIEIQRSRGYATRRSLTMDKITRVIKAIKEVDKDVIVMVDNCYGEFVDELEPVQVGADIMVGSLIKNLGGGLAPNGAYIAGRKDLVELCSERLTSPGQGKEVGPSLGINKSFLQGLYMAPSVVASSLKTAVFTAKMMELLGYKTVPASNEKRADIVQTIEFGNEKDLVKYVQGIQAGSAVDSSSVPMPWDMPGYTDKVIMAAGAFTMGSSIELSCDAPIREPFIAFQQGGLTYEYGKLGVLKAIQNMR
jgi:cystathionine beta-lyase family protein involved in aluminum resistance